MQRQRDENARQTTRARVESIRHRGETSWSEVETEIERSNAAGYDNAASLLLDLHTIATEDQTTAQFFQRIRAICDRHVAKKRFIERLVKLNIADRSWGFE